MKTLMKDYSYILIALLLTIACSEPQENPIPSRSNPLGDDFNIFNYNDFMDAFWGAVIIAVGIFLYRTLSEAFYRPKKSKLREDDHVDYENWGNKDDTQDGY